MTFTVIRSWSMALCCAVALLSSAAAAAQSIRFFGNGSSARDLDRVKIQIDNPSLPADAGPPVDVGQTDFTIEFWLRPDTTAGRNSSGAVSCGSGQYSWINGNIILDRDRYSQQRSFGIALANGRIVFGVWVGGTQHTICGSQELRDGQWHHVAVQRQTGGLIEILVDGQREVSANGPAGDISYPNDGVPTSQTACGGPCTNSDPFIVIGAEKHDVGSAYPAYAGWMSELRFSTVRRYPSATYSVPDTAFSVDADTAGLYRFADGSGGTAADASGRGNPAGQLRVGGNPAGPVWTSESPFMGTTGTINFSPATYTVQEGGGPVTISVSRIGGSSGEATVEIRIAGGTASEGADFTLPASRVLSWAEGESGSRSLSMTIIDDTAAESTETVALELANATGATLGSPAAATVNITDNDSGSSPPGGTPPPGSGNGGGGGGGGGGSPNALYLLMLAGLAANRALRLRKRPVPVGIL